MKGRRKEGDESGEGRGRQGGREEGHCNKVVRVTNSIPLPFHFHISVLHSVPFGRWHEVLG